MRDTIRVLHILQRMEAGGTQALLMNIYRNIDREKIQFDFLVEYPNKEFYDDEISEMGGKVFYTNLRNDFKIINFQKYLKNLIKENNYKIVHVHTYSIGYFCLKTAKECSVPIRIAHSHNNKTTKNSKYLPKLFLQKIYTIYATDLFACSNEAGKYLFKNKKFRVLKNAIDTNRFIYNDEIRKKIRNELNISENIVIGNVGRLHEQKNQLFLLDIFKILKENDNRMKLLIVGSGPLKEKIEKKIIDLKLQDDVILLENRNDVNELYQAMDLFLFPSLFEGLGIVAIEAQVSGLPVLCSDQMPKEIEITCFLEKKSLNDSANEWASKSIEMLHKYADKRKNMEKDIINAGFDIKDVAKKMQKYYLDRYMKFKNEGKNTNDNKWEEK